MCLSSYCKDELLHAHTDGHGPGSTMYPGERTGIRWILHVRLCAVRKGVFLMSTNVTIIPPPTVAHLPRPVATVASDPYECLWSYTCKGAVISVDATPCCSFIAVASADGRLYFIDREGTLLWSVGLDHEAWAVAVSSDGTRVAVGTACKKPADGSVYVFSRSSNMLLRHNVGAPVWGVSLSADGATLAASTWANRAYRFGEGPTGYALEREVAVGRKGLYGVGLSADGSTCVLSSYEDALVVLDSAFDEVARYPLATGSYATRVTAGAEAAIVGLRDGNFAILRRVPGMLSTSRSVAQRPICGAALSEDGHLVALGSFDGRAYVATARGDRLWEFETDADVWSTAMSADGSLVCAGSGDHRVYLIRNHCDASHLREVQRLEAAAARSSRAELEDALRTLADLYLRCGLIDYGLRRLGELAASDPALYDAVTMEFLRADITRNPDHCGSHFELAKRQRVAGEWAEAVAHYQRAARDLGLRHAALHEAAWCFSRLGWDTAARSCIHRTSSNDNLSREEKKAIFTLARSYEDSGYWSEAIRHHQLLISWDIDYVDSLCRLQDLVAAHHPSQAQTRFVDDTGLTVSLLGPQVPRVRDVDDGLIPILEARSRELFVVPGEHAHLQQAIGTWTRHCQPTVSLGDKGLDYNITMYLRYDHSLPSDEIKKQLEMVNFLSLLEQHRGIARSLDIGTATGRYPTLLAGLGVEAFGIDRDLDAIAYANRKKTQAGPPHYSTHDAADLPFDAECFDLITCMMGTFAHLPAESRDVTVREVVRTLRPGGLLVISTWDILCPYLTFLSMYGYAQREALGANSLTQDDTQTFLDRLGLDVVAIQPFAFFSDLFGYELRLDEMTATDIRCLVEYDLAIRATYMGYHGQMFMICAKKR